jgi:hypothetical protein
MLILRVISGIDRKGGQYDARKEEGRQEDREEEEEVEGRDHGSHREGGVSIASFPAWPSISRLKIAR